MSDEPNESIIGFKGKLYRATESVEDLFRNPQGQPDGDISIKKQGDEVIFRLGGRTLENCRHVQLDAVVAESPDQKGLLVTFRHPHTSLKNRTIGVAIAPEILRPEVDGVWVASEGSGGDGTGGNGNGGKGSGQGGNG